MRNITVVLAVLAVTSACGGEAEEPVVETQTATEAAAPAAEIPERIVAERGGFIPEGIEYDPASGRFLTGSLAEGTIFQIHPDGRVTPAVTDPELVSSVGIEVDSTRNRLLVANSDRGAFDGSSQGQAKLGVYNLATGERLAMVELGATIPNRPADAAHFANDVAVAEDGTAYVTDTMQNTIYEVGPDYQASVLHRFEAPESLGLNGIVHHPSGYLLVAGGSTLYKVPVDDPAATSQVSVPEAVEGQDGLVWMPDGRLAITSNSQSRVVALRSTDDWATAEVAGVGSFEGQGTTAAVAGNDVYVVQPHFADQDPPVVQRVTFQ
jgi:sugar lactone lactonase YvrE